MPITQSRMIALIQAAQDYQRALDQVTEMIEMQRQLVEEGQRTHQQACEILFLSAHAKFLLSQPVESALTILAEARHFKLNQRRNDRKAAKARDRRSPGLRPQYSTTAPRSIHSAPEPDPSLYQQFSGDAPTTETWTERQARADAGLDAMAEPEFTIADISPEDKAKIEADMEAIKSNQAVADSFGDLLAPVRFPLTPPDKPGE